MLGLDKACAFIAAYHVSWYNSIYCFHAPILYLAGWTVRNGGVNSEAMPLVPAPQTGTVGYFVFPVWAALPLLVVVLLFASAAHMLIERPCRVVLNRYFSERDLPLNAALAAAADLAEPELDTSDLIQQSADLNTQ